MKTFFKSDFDFMQTFMTDLNQELKHCRVSCSPMYNKESELTTISIDIADKMGDVFLSIDLFQTWDLVRDGKINYSKVLASALTSAENAMKAYDELFDKVSQETQKEPVEKEEDNSYGITETVVGKEELPEFHPEDVVVLAMNRNKVPKKFEEDCALVSMGDVILVLCNKNILEDNGEDNAYVYSKAELKEHGYKKGSDQCELFNEAFKNTSEIYPEKIISFKDFAESDDVLVDELAHSYVVTAESGYNKWLASLYPSTLTTFTRKFKQGCYIVPIDQTCAAVIPDEYFTPGIMFSFQVMNKEHSDSTVSETIFHYDPNGFIETLDDFSKRTTNHIFC